MFQSKYKRPLSNLTKLDKFRAMKKMFTNTKRSSFFKKRQGCFIPEKFCRLTNGLAYCTASQDSLQCVPKINLFHSEIEAKLMKAAASFTLKRKKNLVSTSFETFNLLNIWMVFNVLIRNS